MRRVLPLWASLVAVLLLLQWSGAVAPCLVQPGVPAMALCHAASDGGPAQPGGPGDHADMGCPLCAPLPPLMPVDPPVPVMPVAVSTGLVSERRVQPGPVAPVFAPQQPRAPPILS